jgi:hypothetical protein
LIEIAKPLLHGAAPFSVPIADQHTISDQHAVRLYEAHNVAHEHVMGWGVDPRMWTRREAKSMTNTV